MECAKVIDLNSRKLILRNKHKSIKRAISNASPLNIALLLTLASSGLLGLAGTGTSVAYALDTDSSSSSANIQTVPLLQANTNIDPQAVDDSSTTYLVAGQALMDNGKPTPGTSTDASASSDQISTYIVQDGDTVQSVAAMFDVTENTIRWANDLNSKSTLKKGQELVILPVSGIKYTVKKGDTLKSIASSFKGDSAEILSYNGLSSETDLSVGDQIIIPDGEASDAPSTTSGSISASVSASASAGTPVPPQSVPRLAAITPLVNGQKVPIKSDGGYFIRPIHGGVKTQGLHGHNAVDLASSLNTPIMAAADGTVIVVRGGNSWNGGYGNYVVIKHPNGMETLYAHMNSISVTQGEKVSQGDVIGRMGSTGDSTGVHVHFEVRGGINPF